MTTAKPKVINTLVLPQTFAALQHFPKVEVDAFVAYLQQHDPASLYTIFKDEEGANIAVHVDNDAGTSNFEALMNGKVQPGVLLYKQD